VRPSSNEAITNASPRTSSEGIETYGRTPDPKRKSNLISFSAKEPRNQGVASSQRPETLISNEHQAPHAKQRQVHKLEYGNSTRDDVAITSPHGEAALSKGLDIDDNALFADISYFSSTIIDFDC